ncbi:MAG: head GIN domain-containing protein [Devosia sp.]
MRRSPKVAVVSGGVALLAVAAISILASVPAIAVVSQGIELQPFEEIDVASGLDVDVIVGPAQSVTVTGADPAALRALRLEVRDGRLHAWLDRNLSNFSLLDDAISVTVAVPALGAASAGGSSNVDIIGMTGDALAIQASGSATLRVRNIDAEAMMIEGSGSAVIELSGNCSTATLNVSSAAGVSSKALECIDLNIEASSSAAALVYATGQVNVSASTGASVVVAGHPSHVDDRESTGGDIYVLG